MATECSKLRFGVAKCYEVTIMDTTTSKEGWLTKVLDGLSAVPYPFLERLSPNPSVYREQLSCINNLGLQVYGPEDLMPIDELESYYLSAPESWLICPGEEGKDAVVGFVHIEIIKDTIGDLLRAYAATEKDITEEMVRRDNDPDIKPTDYIHLGSLVTSDQMNAQALYRLIGGVVDRVLQLGEKTAGHPSRVVAVSYPNPRTKKEMARHLLGSFMKEIERPKDANPDAEFPVYYRDINDRDETVGKLVQAVLARRIQAKQTGTICLDFATDDYLRVAGLNNRSHTIELKGQGRAILLVLWTHREEWLHWKAIRGEAYCDETDAAKLPSYRAFQAAISRLESLLCEAYKAIGYAPLGRAIKRTGAKGSLQYRLDVTPIEIT
jgi:hypothetical protein